MWKAKWNQNMEVAVKKFDEESISFNSDEFQNELALMSVVRHENIVHSIGSCEEPENIYIVLELFKKGSIKTLFQTYNLHLPLIIHLALGAAKGMNYLHQLGIIHRDLKCGNLLISDDWNSKVADFGLSRITDFRMTRGVGTPIYTAPEILKGNKYSQKADIYSFAFVLWELYTQQVPFHDIPVVDAAIRACDENLRPKIPDDCIYKDLIELCWQHDPDVRPNFNEIVNILTQIQLKIGLPDELSPDDNKIQQIKPSLPRIRSHISRSNTEIILEDNRFIPSENNNNSCKSLVDPIAKLKENENDNNNNANPTHHRSRSRGSCVSSNLSNHICGNCSSPVIGRSIRVVQKVFHHDCFVCFQCKKLLINEPWYQHEGQMYCADDYKRLFLLACDKCKQPLLENYITAMDKNWHKDCFVCTSCSSPINRFQDLNGDPYCLTCAEKQ